MFNIRFITCVILLTGLSHFAYSGIALAAVRVVEKLSKEDYSMQQDETYDKRGANYNVHILHILHIFIATATATATEDTLSHLPKLNAKQFYRRAQTGFNWPDYEIKRIGVKVNAEDTADIAPRIVPISRISPLNNDRRIETLLGEEANNLLELIISDEEIKKSITSQAEVKDIFPQ